MDKKTEAQIQGRRFGKGLATLAHLFGIAPQAIMPDAFKKIRPPKSPQYHQNKMQHKRKQVAACRRNRKLNRARFQRTGVR